MGEKKQGISRAEAQELVDARVQAAIREVTWLIAVVMPELMKAPQWTPADRQKLAAALHGVAESQKADGRSAAATAAAALAEALDAQAKLGSAQ
jgi:hypothetical protein